MHSQQLWERVHERGGIPPTQEIHETGTERVIDGVRIVFQLTPGTEAPAETPSPSPTCPSSPASTTCGATTARSTTT